MLNTKCWLHLHQEAIHCQLKKFVFCRSTHVYPGHILGSAKSSYVLLKLRNINIKMRGTKWGNHSRKPRMATHWPPLHQLGSLCSPLGWTGCRRGWSWTIQSGWFSWGQPGRWPTPSRPPEPCTLCGSHTTASRQSAAVTFQQGWSSWKDETRQQPPHLMSCPGLATTVAPRRRHNVRHDASRGAASLISRVPW